MLCMWQHEACGNGAHLDASLSLHEGHCSAYQAVPSAQVHQARAEARAEAEAAAEQRLAALDQARRDEREAAVRAALALGVRQVSARPLSGMPSHVHNHDIQCTRHATKQGNSPPWTWLLHGGLPCHSRGYFIMPGRSRCMFLLIGMQYCCRCLR